MSKNDLSQIPSRWETAVLSDVIEDLTSGFPCGDHNQEGRGTPHLRPMNISEKGEIHLQKIKYIEEDDEKTLAKGDVLFNNTNSPKHLGKTAYIESDKKWHFSNHMTRIRVKENIISPKWLAKYLHHLLHRGFYRQHCRNHVNQASINQSFLLENIFVPLPPLTEQKHIVAKIDELFSKLDFGTTEINTAAQNLRHYKQSLLNSAMSGGITKRWRQKNKIRSLDLDEYIKKVDYQCDDDLLNIPDEWRQIPIGSVSEVIPGNSPPSETYNDSGKGIPLINGPTEFGPHPFSETKQTKFTTEPRKKCEEGDLLVCVRGNTTGRINIASSHVAIGRGVAAVRCHLNQNFLNYYLRSKQEYMLNKGTGTTYPSISSKDIRRMPFPLAPPEEQAIIVEKLDRNFSIVEDIESNMEAINKRSKHLRKSILKSAFQGELLPKESHDEVDQLHIRSNQSEDDNSKMEGQIKLTEVKVDDN